jgi:hypothetical protein
MTQTHHRTRKLYLFLKHLGTQPQLEKVYRLLFLLKLPFVKNKNWRTSCGQVSFSKKEGEGKAKGRLWKQPSLDKAKMFKSSFYQGLTSYIY